MIQNQTKPNIEGKALLLEDHFTDNRNSWEEVNNAKEYAGIQKGKYIMENRDDWNWKYYAVNCPLKKYDNFEIHVQLKIENIREMAQTGLVWGFDKNRKVLNRFSISADCKRFSVLHFEKDHRRVYHRFSQKIRTNQEEALTLSITKKDSYLFFKINKENVYICHEAHFCNEGPGFGYYVEPGLKISSNFIEIRQI